MSEISKEYIEREGMTLEVSLYYSLGGYNYFTYTSEARGYYLSVSPVKITKHDGYESVEYVAFTGTKMLLNEVKRKSKKAEQVAIELAEKNREALIEHVLIDNGVVL